MAATLVVPSPQAPGSAPGPNDLLSPGLNPIFSAGFVTNNYGSRSSATLLNNFAPGGIDASVLLGIDRAAPYGDTSETQEPTALIQTVVFSDQDNNGIQFDQEMAMFFRKLEQTEFDNETTINKQMSEFTGIPTGQSVSPRRVYNLPQVNKESLHWQFNRLEMGASISAAKVFEQTRFFFSGWCNTMHKTSGFANPNYLAASTQYNAGQGQNLPGDCYMTDRVVHGFVTAKNVFGNCVYTGAGLFYILREFTVTKEMVYKYYGKDSMRPNYGIYLAEERYRYTAAPYDPRVVESDPNWKTPRKVYIWMPYSDTCKTSITDTRLLKNSNGQLDAVVVKIGNVRHGLADNSVPHLRTFMTDGSGMLDQDAILRRSLDYGVHASAQKRIEINIAISRPVIF